MIDSVLSRPRRLVVSLVLAAGIGGAGTGCGLQAGGTAAEVGDTVITVDEVEGYVQDFAEETGTDNLSTEQAGQVTRSLVERRVTMELFEQVANDLGVTVPEAEQADALRSARSAINEMPPEQYQQVVQQDLITKDTLEDSIRWLTLRDALVTELVGDQQPETQEQATQMQAEFNEALARAAEDAGATVEVNPRFGSWDGASSTLSTDGSALVEFAETDQGQQELPPITAQ